MLDDRQLKEYTLAQLTAGLDVTIQGDADCIVKGVCTIQSAEPNHITFLTNPLYKKHLHETQAAAVILSKTDAEDCPINAIISRDPHHTYALIAAYFDKKPIPQPGIHPTAVIGQHCQIDPTASIGANCVIGDHVSIAAHVIIEPGCVVGDYVQLGEKTRLDAKVILYHRVILGQRVIIASGTIIGSDGFSLAKHKGTWHKVPQLGRVIIEDDVEIGANCTIDRGAVEDTVIEKGAKLDNLIQIAHNVRIGENTAIAGCAGIAGSTTVGKNCLIAGAAGLAGHITIADNVVITGGSAITKSIREPGIYSSGVGGVVTNQEWRKNSARVHRLDQLNDRVKILESALKELIERKS